MDLYAFGFNGHSQFHVLGGRGTPSSTTDIPIPTSVLRAQDIKVLWHSWCDAVIAYQAPDGEPALLYSGTGLTAVQSTYLTQSRGPELLRVYSRDATCLKFFGAPAGDGLRGVVISGSAADEKESSMTKLIVFATDQEIEAGIPAIQTHDKTGPARILNIRITSNGSLHVAVRLRETEAEQIVELNNISELRQCLGADDNNFVDVQDECIIAGFAPTQWCSNGTTSTVLDADGRVYTFTSDPRYPKCLGRPFEPTHHFETLPYLSETSVAKIAAAAGGFMTAAVTSDGELFIWGQSCPGSDGELATLKPGPNDSTLQDQEDQDEFVKNAIIKINDEEAQIYDVGVGFGHILVAAEVRTSASLAIRKVYAAGEGDKGQLGLGRTKEFVDDFREIIELRGKKVFQLECAGWSSLVVTSTEN